VKLNTTFEKIGFASDTYLGYLTVSPRHLGSSLTFKTTISIPCHTFFESKDAIREQLQQLQHQSGIRGDAEDAGGMMNLTISSD
jgi:protein-arginine kinase